MHSLEVLMGKQNKLIGIIGKVGNKSIEATNGLTLLADGDQLLRSFEIIHTNTKRIELYTVKYFLLSRTIELYLKSLIKFSTGDTIQNHKKHSLSRAYEFVKQHLSFTTDDKEIIQNLDKYYPEKVKRFEYTQISNDGMTLPTIEDTLKLTNKLRISVIKFKDDESNQRYL